MNEREDYLRTLLTDKNENVYHIYKTKKYSRIWNLEGPCMYIQYIKTLLVRKMNWEGCVCGR